MFLLPTAAWARVPIAITTHVFKTLYIHKDAERYGHTPYEFIGILSIMVKTFMNS